LQIEILYYGLAATAVVIGGGLKLGKAVWDFAWGIHTSIETIGNKVDLILTNHLPHLQEDIKELRDKIDG
jgi:hypothetical protein